jgi:hypothetical protein
LEGGIVNPVAYRPDGSSKAGNILTTFGQKQRFKIIESGGGITGQFDGVRQSAALRARLVYTNSNGSKEMTPVAARPIGAAAADVNDPMLVFLELERNSYASLGNTKARAEVGRGLDLLVAAAAYNKEIEDIIAQFDGLQLVTTPEEVPLPPGAAAAVNPNVVAAGLPGGMSLLEAMDAVFPKAFAEMYALSLSRVQDVQKTVSDRLNLLGTAVTSVSEQEVLSLATGTGGEWNAWTNGYGSFRSKSANLAAGEGGSSVNAYGDVTGVERRFGRATFGIMGASG